MASLPIDAKLPWRDVPIIWIDVETTGTVPGFDRVVELGLVRSEHGKPVVDMGFRVDPGMPIPPDSTEIHGISDKDVAGCPNIEQAMSIPIVGEMFEGAQPAAYNAGFDKAMLLGRAVGHEWPWLDAMVGLMLVDPYVKGKGRYKLESACKRHKVDMDRAHSAVDDAMSACKLFFSIADELEKKHLVKCKTMLDVVARMEFERVKQWHRFHTWLAEQPPKTDSETRA